MNFRCEIPKRVTLFALSDPSKRLGVQQVLDGPLAARPLYWSSVEQFLKRDGFGFGLRRGGQNDPLGIRSTRSGLVKMAKGADAERQRIGRLGGLETSREHGRELVQKRGSKGGTVTRTLYGVAYFRHIALRRWGRE